MIVDYYYWHGKSNRGKTLEEELLNVDGVTEVQIATAFLSSNGVAILSKLKEHYNLQKEDIKLFISQEFSMNKPHIILSELLDLCIVKIVCDINLHAKIYFLKGKVNKILLGSSNLTTGGFQNNLEFNCIKYEENIGPIELFFSQCEKKSLPVDKDIISAYKNYAAELGEFDDTRKKANKVFSKIFYTNDPFKEDDYNLKNHYFQFQDYETFFPRNREKSDSVIHERRKKIQEKMLAIHKKIYSKIKSKGIMCHKRTENITSSIVPSDWNRGQVAWLGVRYGKTPREIALINEGIDREEQSIYGFQKNGCLQYSIGGYGFEVNLFLAVKNDAVDRSYVHKNLCSLEPRIISEMNKIKGKGMEWIIEDDSGFESIFDIDSDDISSFCKWFRENDKDGRFSYLRTYYRPNNKILKDINAIGNEVVTTIDLLLPLYNTLVWRP